MALPRTGGMLPNGNFNPVQYSTYMQAIYHSTHVVPLISNRDYEGDISKPGSKVIIRKQPDVEVFDYTVGQDLEKQQALADDVIELDIDYGNYFNIPINDVDAFLSDINIQMQVADRGAIKIGDKIEQRVLRTIWASAGSSVDASGLCASNALLFFRQAALNLDELNVPEENRWAVIDPLTAYFLLGTELRLATTTGGTNDTVKTGRISQPVAGFDLYLSNNLQATRSAAKVLYGHMDALAFAAKFQKSEVVRDTKDFADLLRTLVVYGFKAVKPEALGVMDVKSFGALTA